MKKVQPISKIIIVISFVFIIVLIHILGFYYNSKLKAQNTRLQQKVDDKNQQLTELYKHNPIKDTGKEIKGESDKIERIEEQIIIHSIDNCQKEYSSYEPYADDSIQIVDNTIFIHQSFSSYGNKVGWCLYHIQENTISLIAGGPNHRGIEVATFIQDKYVLYGQGCGTECYYITVIDITDPSYERIYNSAPYFELSEDSKWVVFYVRALYASEENTFSSDHEYEFMAKAVNLDTFKEIKFADNPYFNNGSIENFDKYNNYWIDIHDIDFINEEEGIITIPFIEQESKRETIRSFDINNNFEEIVE